jgi:hypothetical protein
MNTVGDVLEMKNPPAKPRFRKRWMGQDKVCELCLKPFTRSIGERLFDARLRVGPWAALCSDCFATNGIGIGTGRGQEYTWDGEIWEKTCG